MILWCLPIPLVSLEGLRTPFPAPKHKIKAKSSDLAFLFSALTALPRFYVGSFLNSSTGAAGGEVVVLCRGADLLLQVF